MSQSFSLFHDLDEVKHLVGALGGVVPFAVGKGVVVSNRLKRLLQTEINADDYVFIRDSASEENEKSAVNQHFHILDFITVFLL